MRTSFLFFAASGLTFGLIFGGCRTRTSPAARIWEESVSNALKPTEGSVSLEALAREFQSLICGHERLAFALRLCDCGLISLGTPSDSVEKIFGQRYYERTRAEIKEGDVYLTNDLLPPPDDCSSQVLVGWRMKIYYDDKDEISGYRFTNLQKEPGTNLHGCWTQEWSRAEALLPLVPLSGKFASNDRKSLDQAVKRGEEWSRIASEFRDLESARERRAYAVLLFDSGLIRWGVPISTVKAIFREAFLDRGLFAGEKRSGVIYLTDSPSALMNNDPTRQRSQWRITVYYDEEGVINGYYLTNLWRRI